MTLDIEREFREFKNALMGYKGEVWSAGNMQLAFDMWLLAKRAVVGSAEPVGGVEIADCPNCGSQVVVDVLLPQKLDSAKEVRQRRLTHDDTYWRDVLPSDDDAKPGVEFQGYEYRTLFTAPPAPVSAEPVGWGVFWTEKGIKCRRLSTSQAEAFEFAARNLSGDGEGSIDPIYRDAPTRAELVLKENQLDDLTEHRLRSILREIGMTETADSAHLAGDLFSILGIMRGKLVPPTTDAKDSERLDWLLNNLITFHAILFDGATPLMYRGRYLKSPEKLRAEIDAAIAAKEAGK